LSEEIFAEDEIDDQNEQPEIYDEEEITDDDFGFILDGEGNLKSVFVPVEYEIIPEKVYAIFKLYGIEDETEIHARIGHVVH
jgi:hypothetical protein